MRDPVNEILNFAETAEAVGYKPRSWSRHWKSFVATRGFPAPLPSPTTLRRPRWSREQVVAWIRRGGTPATGLDARLEDYAEGRRHAA